MQRFKDKSQELKLSRSIVTDVTTRWNSLHAMLERMVELRQLFQFVISSDDSLQLAELNENEWTMIESVVKLLRPFLLFTKFASYENRFNLSASVILFRDLVTHCQSFNEENPCFAMAQSAIQWLNHYKPKIINEDTLMATALDPLCVEGIPRSWLPFVQGEPSKHLETVRSSLQQAPLRPKTPDEQVHSNFVRRVH